MVDVNEAEKLALAFVGVGHCVQARELPQGGCNVDRSDLRANYFVFVVINYPQLTVGGSNYVGVERATGNVIALGSFGE